MMINLRERVATKSMDYAMEVISEVGEKACMGTAVFFTVHWLGKTEAFTITTA